MLSPIDKEITKRRLRYGTFIPPALAEGLDDLKLRLAGQTAGPDVLYFCLSYVEDLLEHSLLKGEINEYKVNAVNNHPGQFDIQIMTAEKIDIDKLEVDFKLSIE